MMFDNATSVSFGIASPERIREWSSGEVTNGNTFHDDDDEPILGGLFCGRIFGYPRRWSCTCTALRGKEFSNSLCSKCGERVEPRKYHRGRMGHIELAVPVAHPWYRKSGQNWLAVALGVPPQLVEDVLEFTKWLNLKPQEDCATRLATIETATQTGRAVVGEKEAKELKSGPEAIHIALQRLDLLQELQALRLDQETARGKKRRQELDRRIQFLEEMKVSNTRPEWMMIQTLPVPPPDLRPLREVDRPSGLRFPESSKPRRIALRNQTILVSDDLNFLYAQVLKCNQEVEATKDQLAQSKERIAAIVDLQDAVDALLDSSKSRPRQFSRHSKPPTSLTKRFWGKTGRFRHSLLGKRVNFSGRSVIVVGPELKLHQCGLPKHMALELFQPFIIQDLLRSALANSNGAHAEIATKDGRFYQQLKRVFQEGDPTGIRRIRQLLRGIPWPAFEVDGSPNCPLAAAMAALERILRRGHPVLINRAPTFHRHSIQAFEAVLVEGDAIQLHPLVCSAYNADFDGDTVAVHVPLSVEAQLEARTLMMAQSNLLHPGNGRLITPATQDIMLGCYCLTADPHYAATPTLRLPLFGATTEVIYAYDTGKLRLQDRIRLANPDLGRKTRRGDGTVKVIETTVGRVLFNELFPPEIGYINTPLRKQQLLQLLEECYRHCGRERTVVLLDQLKDLGFRASTKAAVSIGIDDLPIPAGREAAINEAKTQAAELDKQCRGGDITEVERRKRVLEAWQTCSTAVKEMVESALRSTGNEVARNPVWIMLESGARGNKEQVCQLAGMKGLVVKPNGDIIESPILTNYREGLSPADYFISAHGARKGQQDTAMKTGLAGYFMRKLVNLVTDVVVDALDCKTTEAVNVPARLEAEQRLAQLVGRMAAEEVPSMPVTDQPLLAVNQEITHDLACTIASAGIEEVKVRSVLTCKSARGVCALCYGRNFATDQPASLGDAIGIIAAQSLGEPGTQLTLRTFHAGGVASKRPLQPASEAQPAPKRQAPPTTMRDNVQAAQSGSMAVSSLGKNADITDALARLDRLFSHTATGPKAILARIDGVVSFGCGPADKSRLILSDLKSGISLEHRLPKRFKLVVSEGESVQRGQQLTEGSVDPKEMLEIIGPLAFQQAFVKETQAILSENGVAVHDKHIEVLVRQMLRAVEITHAGDTQFMVGDHVEKCFFEQENYQMAKLGGKPAEAKQILLGITNPRLETDSPLANAGFREPAKVLTSAAVFSKVDRLQGLRERLMAGELVPVGTGFEAYRKVELRPTAAAPGGLMEVVR